LRLCPLHVNNVTFYQNYVTVLLWASFTFPHYF
jgi:hypothetical protein